MVIIPDDWYRFFIFNNRKIDVTLNLNDQIRGGVHDQRAMARSAKDSRKGKGQKQPKAAEQQKEQDKEQDKEVAVTPGVTLSRLGALGRRTVNIVTVDHSNESQIVCHHCAAF